MPEKDICCGIGCTARDAPGCAYQLLQIFARTSASASISTPGALSMCSTKGLRFSTGRSLMDVVCRKLHLSLNGHATSSWALDLQRRSSFEFTPGHKS